MFADADLDLKKRQKADEAVDALVELANQGFWEDNFDLLGAIFMDKGIPRNDHFELSKNDFVSIMKDAGCIIKPKVNEKEEEKKGDDKKKQTAEAAKDTAVVKFEEMDIHHSIQDSKAFDDD